MALYSLYGSATLLASSGKNTIVSVSATATALVSADTSRLGMTIQNLGSKTVYLGFSNTLTSSNYAIAINAGTAYEFPLAFTGALWAISASGSQSVNVVEMS